MLPIIQYVRYPCKMFLKKKLFTFPTSSKTFFFLGLGGFSAKCFLTKNNLDNLSDRYSLVWVNEPFLCLVCSQAGSKNKSPQCFTNSISQNWHFWRGWGRQCLIFLKEYKIFLGKWISMPACGKNQGTPQHCLLLVSTNPREKLGSGRKRRKKRKVSYRTRSSV